MAAIGWQWSVKAVVQAIISNHPEIVLHTGDMLGAGDDYDAWGPKFFKPVPDPNLKN